jgi:hypothetical protein
LLSLQEQVSLFDSIESEPVLCLSPVSIPSQSSSKTDFSELARITRFTGAIELAEHYEALARNDATPVETKSTHVSSPQPVPSLSKPIITFAPKDKVRFLDPIPYVHLGFDRYTAAASHVGVVESVGVLGILVRYSPNEHDTHRFWVSASKVEGFEG